MVMAMVMTMVMVMVMVMVMAMVMVMVMVVVVEGVIYGWMVCTTMRVARGRCALTTLGAYYFEKPLRT